MVFFDDSVFTHVLRSEMIECSTVKEVFRSIFGLSTRMNNEPIYCA